MASYLVTGGAGFIGSNIVERLLKDGNKVRIVDNLVTGKFDNIREFIDIADFICGDLADYRIAEKAVDGIDYIIHQAAIPSVPRSVKDPIATNESIVTATVNLFKAAVEGKSVKRVVQAASSSAYGDTPTLPKREDMIPNPLSPYAVAKLTQEYYGKAFYNVYGLEVLSLRYFNVFGPKQDPKSFYSAVIPKFISIIMEGKQPTIYGDGETSRDFTYIDNVVEANLSACLCKWPGSSEVMNIGCGERISLNELVVKINSILSTDIIPLYAETRVGDVKHSLADITKAKEILGYDVKVSVDEGLRKLIKWLSNNNQ
ncbi:MAG: SDR family oxidoreductase [Clostridia bacterium]|nr:SDR family oxidoreductase [Clostridia bacterium]